VSELKACPFCGSRAEGPEKEITKGSRNPIWYIHCTMWCVRLSAGTKKSVVGQWNHRATKAVSPAKDAEVVESLCPCDYCAKGPYCKSLCNGEIEMISDCFQGRRLTDSKEGA